MRGLQELTDVAEPARPWVLDLLQGAGDRCEVLPPGPGRREAALTELQVSLASALGAVVWHTGLVMVDHRWLRLFGASTADSPPARIEPLRGTPPHALAEGVVFAADVLGGCFAIHGSGLDADPGEVCYWAPDSLRWAGLGLGHSGFLDSLLGEDATERWSRFYDGLRWPGWEQESAELSPGQGLAIYPPTWSEQGLQDLAATHRRPVPLREVIDVGFDAAAQLDHPSASS